MYNFLIATLAIGILSTSGFGLGNNSNEEKVAQAEKSAQKWLTLIDSSRYADSWLETSQYFQNNVTQEDYLILRQR